MEASRNSCAGCALRTRPSVPFMCLLVLGAWLLCVGVAEARDLAGVEPSDSVPTWHPRRQKRRNSDSAYSGVWAAENFSTLLPESTRVATKAETDAGSASRGQASSHDAEHPDPSDGQPDVRPGLEPDGGEQLAEGGGVEEQSQDDFELELDHAKFESLHQVQLFEEGDLHQPEVLESAVAARSYRGEIILIITDINMADMAVNLVLNLALLHLGHYLILADSAATCRHLVRRGLVTGCGYSTVMDAVLASLDKWGFYTAKDLLWMQRSHYIGRIAAMGYNVLSTDADVVFHHNPYPFLKGPVLRRHTFIVQGDGQGDSFPSMNMGAMYVQNAAAGGPVVWILEELRRRVTQRIQGEVARCRDGNVNMGVIWDQNVFNDLVEAAACGCEGRERGRECSHASEADGLAVFDALHREEFRWSKDAAPHARPTSRQRDTGYFPLNDTLRHVALSIPGSGGAPHGGPRETLAKAPSWLFALFRDSQGWSRAELPPMVLTHFVAHGSMKRAYMRLYSAWFNRAEDRIQGTGRDTGQQLKLLVLRHAPQGLWFEERGAFRELVGRLVGLAALSQRLLVLPQPACNSTWIHKFEQAFQGVHDPEVHPGRCPEEGGAGARCCHYMPLQDRCRDLRELLYSGDFLALLRARGDHLASAEASLPALRRTVAGGEGKDASGVREEVRALLRADEEEDVVYLSLSEDGREGASDAEAKITFLEAVPDVAHLYPPADHEHWKDFKKMCADYRWGG